MLIARILEFLQKSSSLAEEFKELKNEIFSSGTTALLAKVLPRDYMEHVYDQIDSVQATEEEKINRICEYLEKKKTSALLVAQNAPDKKEPPLMSMTASAGLGHNHDCKTGQRLQEGVRIAGLYQTLQVKDCPRTMQLHKGDQPLHKVWRDL